MLILDIEPDRSPLYDTKLKIAIDSQAYTQSNMNGDDGTGHATRDQQSMTSSGR